jgi:hypothetical protein
MKQLAVALALALALGCGSASEATRPPEPGAAPAERPPSASPGGASPGGASPAPGAQAQAPSCADFAALAGQPLDRASRLDLDGDGLLDAVVGPPSCGLRCDYRLYRQARDGCWLSVGELADLMSEPACDGAPARGTWCQLSGMRLMIHGDAQEYIFTFDGTRYGGSGFPGEHYVPPRRKQP